MKSSNSYKSNKINFFLSNDLIPKDKSFQKLLDIESNYKIYKKLICLPDLNFKIKNYVPSGIVIPTINEFSPKLLGPNNDGMSILRLKIKDKLMTQSKIKFIFQELKKKICIYRRKKNIIDDKTAKKILKSGLKSVITEWGFEKKDLLKFQNKGCIKEFKFFDEIKKIFPKQRPKNLGDHIKNINLIDRAKKNIGVLDGSSHFVELYDTKKIFNKKFASKLRIENKNDFYFLIHAGSADIGIIIHQFLSNLNKKKFSLKNKETKKILNLLSISANYGFANRLFILKIIKDVLENVFTNDDFLVEIFNDNNHDFLDFEKKDQLFIHRKGAVRLEPGGKNSSLNEWVLTGEPYFMPSYVGGDGFILSNFKYNEDSLNCSSHGVGRMINKNETFKKFKKINFKKSLDNNLMLFRYNVDQIKSQNPKSFKNINSVLKNFKKFNLCKPISRHRPLASLKA